MNWKQISQRVTDGGEITQAEALGILNAPDDALLSVLDAAFAIRLRYFGRGVRLHVLCNARSGGCSEDCGYCSQSAHARQSATQRYPWRSNEELVAGAREAHRMKAIRYCVVSSGRAPADAEMKDICETVRSIKAEVPTRVCLSLGLLSPMQARQLKGAGVDRYNHNLETSERHFPHLCTTHSYADRVATARAVKAAGLELCCGGLLGAGETAEDRVDLAFALRDLAADSIPINFLDPRPGTPLERYPRIKPASCLRALAMFRFVHPSTEIRIAGGREACLGAMQALALYPANSMFTEGYLTMPGQGYAADMALLDAAGFRVDGVTQVQRPAHDETVQGQEQ